MRTTLWLAFAIVALAACNVDFVAVERDQRDEEGFALLQVAQMAGLVASLHVALPETPQPPVVLVGGSPLQGVALDDGRWAFQTEVAVDSLLPRLELEIRTDEVVVVPLAFVARNGSATRRENGDLEIPVVYGGDPSEADFTWQMLLLDSDGKQLTTVHSTSGGWLNPLVISSALVPPTAVAAQVAAIRKEEINGAPYVLKTETLSIVRVPIEPGH